MIPASRRTRFFAIAVVLLLLIAGGVIALTLIAPQSSESVAQDANTRPDCLTDTDDTCLALPTFSGTDLNDTTYTFPQALSGDYQLIVMPFDRDQQVRAATWLEPFREIADDYESVEYYSIAALPDLNPAIRGLVVSGMRFNVQDELTRARLIIVFLENQAAFLETLNITDTDTIRLFITDADGTLYWQSRGDYDLSTADELREALARLAG